MFILLALLACSGDTSTGTDTGTLPACGNGITEPDEQCDDGDANSDDAADACRTSCRLPACGDGVADGGEDCDDGNGWGGDGCLPTCAAEDGPLESEPNDTWDGGQALSDTVSAALPSGDVDCFTLEAAACDAITAETTGDCTGAVVLSLHDPDGAAVAASSHTEDGCAVIDPYEEPGARYAAAGTWAVCAEALVGAEVPVYQLSASAGPAGDGELPDSTFQDLDGDGLHDTCDADRDGDGVDNDDDECPDLVTPDETTATTADGGFIRLWLAIGPFTGETSPDGCLPSEVDLLGDDAATAPALGDVVDGVCWEPFARADDRLDFSSFAYVGAPREVYIATYVYSDTTLPATLALGPDDGARAWINGEVVLEVTGCQGTNVDQFTAPVTLEPGWNRLMVKVYDQGGGWGSYVRFLDAQGAPITGLELSLSPD